MLFLSLASSLEEEKPRRVSLQIDQTLMAMHLHSGASGGGSMNGHVNEAQSSAAGAASNRSVERILDDAQMSGELCLSGRSLKTFPSLAKHNLIDTCKADLSRNRFAEVPAEVCAFVFAEQLNLSENLIRSVPDAFSRLRCLVELDLSRNNLTAFPVVFCKLPLQILLLDHNRISSIPEEIGQMRCLKELGLSCNELTRLPLQISTVTTLRSLDLRKNRLSEFPTEVIKVPLTHLDLSENEISTLPLSLISMTSLQTIHLSHNPLECPAAQICAKGKIHIFKSLERLKMGKILPNGSEVTPARKTSLGFMGRMQSMPEKERSPYAHLSPATKSLPNGSDSPKTLSPLVPLLTSSFSKKPDPPVYAVPDSTLRPVPQSPSCPVNLSSIAPLSNGHLAVTQSSSNNSSTPSSSATEVPCSEGAQSVDSSGASNEEVSASSKSSNDTKDTEKKTVKISSQIPKKNISPSHVPNGTALRTPKGSIASHSPTPRGTTKPVSATAATNGRVVAPHDYSSRSKSSTNVHAEPASNGVDGKETTPVESVRTPSTRPTYQKPPMGRRESGSSGGKPSALGSTVPSKHKSPADKSDGKDPNPNFTIRRQQEQLREESEKIDALRKHLEARLKLKLPEDLMDALQDGVMLCHFVNSIRPRSVVSIHVPSPTQSGVLKLTSAKCRRNVENFLEACRRLGVPDAQICTSADILEAKSPVKICSSIHHLLTNEEKAPKRGGTTAGTTPRSSALFSARSTTALRDVSLV
ncbi:hypothetical protein RvY_12099-2 [Ramazzottius varieornatus]|uniref:Calponin-homology (CH) domain-containing protein n=1 Tax=Ramazzottius varieornatus TaxID=947166 RepID=A0A1D1VIB3_RAMVA|nr:hypothetical protein RvY_12099-2 [Ramazzottius varieornatus]